MWTLLLACTVAPPSADVVLFDTGEPSDREICGDGVDNDRDGRTDC
jgi:hypothetical protein